jgi:hypothetical protein
MNNEIGRQELKIKGKISKGIAEFLEIILIKDESLLFSQLFLINQNFVHQHQHLIVDINLIIPSKNIKMRKQISYKRNLLTMR